MEEQARALLVLYAVNTALILLAQALAGRG